MSGPLKGRVALVTGASRGIGRAVALELGRAGASVALLSTHVKGTQEARERLTSEKARAISVEADVSQPAQLDAALGKITKDLGPVDILVNNAAVAPRLALAEMKDEHFDRTLAVNLSGPFYLCRRLAPAMAQRGWGRVINISSISGTLGTPKLSAYCASKWGLNGLTKALAEELKDRGVLVAAVLPGSVDTDMLKGSGFKPKMTAEQVAGVVRYLCAEAPLAMSGALVEVFG